MRRNPVGFFGNGPRARGHQRVTRAAGRGSHPGGARPADARVHLPAQPRRSSTRKHSTTSRTYSRASRTRTTGVGRALRERHLLAVRPRLPPLDAVVAAAGPSELQRRSHEPGSIRALVTGGAGRASARHRGGAAAAWQLRAARGPLTRQRWRARRTLRPLRRASRHAGRRPDEPPIARASAASDGMARRRQRAGQQRGHQPLPDVRNQPPEQLDSRRHQRPGAAAPVHGLLPHLAAQRRPAS